MMYFNNNEKSNEHLTPAQLLAAFVLISIICGIFGLFQGAQAEEADPIVIEDEEWIVLDDPDLFLYEEVIEEEIPVTVAAKSESDFPVITSVGKEIVKKGGVKSKGTLIRYTIPEALLRADPTFLKLMVEAEKYIGYPYVYGASSPSDGFDCAGFVCYVFRKSGVYKLSNHGANGLHDLCREVSEKEARPGDLVFFKDTMGKNVKGITHVGIYVGNGMMIHAGDPVGFADIRSEQWSKKIVCYGRLPIK